MHHSVRLSEGTSALILSNAIFAFWNAWPRSRPDSGPANEGDAARITFQLIGRALMNCQILSIRNAYAHLSPLPLITETVRFSVIAPSAKSKVSSCPPAKK
jgi:hypothetical protein